MSRATGKFHRDQRKPSSSTKTAIARSMQRWSSACLAELAFEDELHDQTLSRAIGELQAVDVDAVLAALTNAGLPGGGGAAPGEIRRIELCRDLSQPSLALLRRDRRGPLQ
jgi:hypothetical protein